jgi:hypothetical protein
MESEGEDPARFQNTVRLTPTLREKTLVKAIWIVGLARTVRNGF